ncbi:MAG: octanoyltransferase [Gammaproteobacteria bacterium GWF2_41_13]|nr:MAG: octanoyltransferase [Gammaproteobacteria bacterium GWF2_41_13]
MMNSSLLIRKLGRCDYQLVFAAMQQFTAMRTDTTPDELWLVEHDPVFTQGHAGKAEHLLCPGGIPVVQTNRGGQITYHGPGQLVIYLLVDLRRLNKGIRDFVTAIERSVIQLLADYQIIAESQATAPGVYAGGAKICSIGLKVSRGCTYHGLALNVRMDLSPFSRINPCGFKNLQMKQISDFVPDASIDQTANLLVNYLKANLGYPAAVELQVGLPSCQ